MKILLISSFVLLILINEIAWALNFVTVGRNMNYHQALHACRRRGLRLATVRNHHENNQLFHYARSHGLGRYWINANDISQERHFKYANGQSIVYARWHRGEPNNWHNEDCVHGYFFGNSDWNDISCNSRNTAICMRSNRRRRPGKTINRNRIIYAGNNRNYWQALQLCRSKGMTLIRIPNDATNNIVYRMAVSMRVGRYWINANDIRREGDFRYDNEHHIQFSKWYRGEPNNWHNEDCVHGLFYGNGYWNDINCSTKNAVFCYGKVQKPRPKPRPKPKPKPEVVEEKEIVTTITKEVFLIDDALTFDEAVELCHENSLHLMHIDSSSINREVKKLLEHYKVDKIWINASDAKHEGSWQTKEGKSLKYKNFRSGNPNGGSHKNCASISRSDGKWSDEDCNASIKAVCVKS